MTDAARPTEEQRAAAFLLGYQIVGWGPTEGDQSLSYMLCTRKHPTHDQTDMIRVLTLAPVPVLKRVLAEHYMKYHYKKESINDPP